MNYYPLTSPQQNIWNLQKYYEQTSIGNISGMITLKSDGKTDLSPALNYAFNKLIENADSLRLRFTIHNGEVQQYVVDYKYEDVPIWDFSNLTNDEVNDRLQAEAETPFDLHGEKPMVRFAIIKHNDIYSAFMVIHHLICDGWTSNLIANKVAEYVQQFGCENAVIETLPSYINFIQDEQKYRQGRRFERDSTYWDDFATQFGEPSFVKPKMPGSDDVRSARYIHHLTQEETNRIKSFCTENNCSPDTLFKTAVGLYIYKLNRIPSVVIGMPVLNRDGAVAKNTVGMYVSTMPLRLQIEESKSIAEIMDQCVTSASEMFRHCKYPFSDIQTKVKSKHPEVSTLYDVLISYEYSSIGKENIDGVRWFYQGYSENALVLHIDDRDGNNCFDISYDYQCHMFRTEEEVELVAKRIQYIIAQIIRGEVYVKDIRIIPEAEYNRIVYEFNATESPYPRDKCLHTLFAEQVQKTPNKTAVVCDNRALTYRELDHMSNNLASVLNINVGDVVALHMHRSEMIMVAQLAVLKAGGIFLPIDITVPTERMDDMLEDCNAKYIIIGNEEIGISLRSDTIQILNINTLEISKHTSSLISSAVTAEMGAHIIYTSGSTGKPKGSVLTHRGLVNFVFHNLVVVPDKCEYDNSISINTISFDMFMCETITPLVVGITIHIATEKQQTSQEIFAKYVLENNIQFLQTTPTRYKILTADKNNLDYLKNFKCVLLSGEPFTTEVYHELVAHTDAHIFNVCGPSENHIWIVGGELMSDDITLGYPVKNTQIYILDEKQNPLPIGVPGELCVSGDCIGLGYLNRPELNKEKYIPHPFIENRSMYRTGDLALIRPNGVIEHLGRIDTQVKIRGLRVELGEIESNICAFDGITNTAVVIVKHDGKDFLCAFYQSTLKIDEAELKAALAKVMPNYMIPNLFIRLESFPMTSSGKIARGVLGKYDISGLTTSEEYKAPETELQELLCKEFERLLKLSPVSINLDFFGAGGNSIHVIEMLAHLPEEFHLSAKDIYDHPTVKALAEFIGTRTEKEYETVSRLVKGGDKQVIVCFPFAGSDDSTFIDLASALKTQLPTVTVYALRHANWTEVDFSKAIEEVSQIIEKAESVVFYSHCAGSAMALKLYQHLPDNSKIKRIVMGGNVPPKGIKLYGKRLNPWKFMSDEKLLHTLQNVGMELDGMSEAVKAKLAKQFRIDTECYFREMALLDGVFDIPCTLIVSDADKFTPHIDKAQHAWQHYFKHPIDMVVIHGANHYFHIQRADEVANAIIGLGDLK